MGIFLGLATALSWGSSDFLARFASRRIGSLRAVFYMQAWGFVFLTGVIFAFHRGNHLFDGSGWHPWAWGLLAGGINALAMLALYHSFAIGKLSVVAPLSASYPVLTLLLSLFSGERLSLARYLGIGATILGAVLVARGEFRSSRAGEADSPSRNRGLVWAIVAAVGFGVLFWLLGIRIISTTGPIAAVWLIRATGSLVTLALVLSQRLPLRLPKATRWQTVGMGALDTGAFLLSNLGMQLEQISVVSVLGSLYGAVTVGLAAAFLREHVKCLQWCGIVLIFGGIFLISR
jgi:drug/metabolite transporter (DMT)-like permease